jgi:hypothetical protein
MKKRIFHTVKIHRKKSYSFEIFSLSKYTEPYLYKSRWTYLGGVSGYHHPGWHIFLESKGGSIFL